MRFVCPRCHHHLTSHDAKLARCPACGIVLDIANDETEDGRPALPVDRDLSGQVLGGFAIGKWIGAGGMGIVYEAEDVETGDAVALKVLAPYLGAQPDFVERFRREAQALKQLRHPNIVAFREDGQADGRYYIAMELLRGRSLEDALAEGRLEPDDSFRVATAVAQALQAAHSRGITHLDLKPANIILGDSDNIVKVVDFGIAQFGLPDMTLTRSDAILGTVNYMAPEQRSGARTVGHRADIFSLGVILYRCLTGELPVGSFEPPSHFVDSWSSRQGARVDATLLRMLQREAGKRQPNMDQVLAELEALRTPLRSRAPAYAAAAVAALGAVVAVVGFATTDPAESEKGKGAEIAKVATPPPPIATPPAAAKPAAAPPTQQKPAAAETAAVTDLKETSGNKSEDVAKNPPPTKAKKPTPAESAEARAKAAARKAFLKKRADQKAQTSKGGYVPPERKQAAVPSKKARTTKSKMKSKKSPPKSVARPSKDGSSKSFVDYTKE